MEVILRLNRMRAVMIIARDDESYRCYQWLVPRCQYAMGPSEPLWEGDGEFGTCVPMCVCVCHGYNDGC